ncbi:SGNH/GDSL hydrolase family protein [Virgibacillus oceani]
MRFEAGEKILFIGDSITEDNRFQDEAGLGAGYVRHIHDYFALLHPELKLQIVNKGISGNRVVDLKARWETDVIEEKPDWLSVSIGVNDVWRQLDRPNIEQIHPAEFMDVYRELLKSVKDRTNANLIILEPTVIEEDEQSEGNLLLKEYIAITSMLSKEFDAIHVPMHHRFIAYIRAYPGNKLTTDGVHMNTLGRMLMTLIWLESAGLIEVDSA